MSTLKRLAAMESRKHGKISRRFVSIGLLPILNPIVWLPQLEDAVHLSAQDLKYSSSTIQADLDRFQRQKVADLREMAISMAKSHRDWCKKVGCGIMLFLCPSDLLVRNQNLDAWEEAKREIEKIPEHPNRAPIPEQEVDVGTNPSARRNSSSTVNGR